MRFRRVLSVAVLLAATIALAHTHSLGDPQQWRGVALARALAAADTIDNPYRRAETLASIARVQTLIGETARDRTPHRSARTRTHSSPWLVLRPRSSGSRLSATGC